MSPIKHKLGSPWPHRVVCAVADDWLANNRFASAALGTVIWTLMGAYHDADWGARALWSNDTFTSEPIAPLKRAASTNEYEVKRPEGTHPAQERFMREGLRFVTSMGDGTENEP